MPSLSSPAQAVADRAHLSVGAEFFNLGASHLSTRAKLAGEENSHVLPSQTIAALGAQARDDLFHDHSNSNSFTHGGRV